MFNPVFDEPHQRFKVVAHIHNADGLRVIVQLAADQHLEEFFVGADSTRKDQKGIASGE